jgi:hypothetical protein
MTRPKPISQNEFQSQYGILDVVDSSGIYTTDKGYRVKVVPEYTSREVANTRAADGTFGRTVGFIKPGDWLIIEKVK